MTTVRDFFVHLDETLKIPVQLLDSTGQPVDLGGLTIQFATGLEFSTENIELLSNANTAQISVVNANTAVVQVSLRPTANLGYSETNHQYQLRAIDDDGVVTVYLEGKLFIDPSLFD